MLSGPLIGAPLTFAYLKPPRSRICKLGEAIVNRLAAVLSRTML